MKWFVDPSTWIVIAGLIIFVSCMIFFKLLLTLERFIKYAVPIIIATSILAFFLYFDWREEKQLDKLPEYLAHIVGLAVAFVNLLLFAAISKKLWYEEHHRWITQIRIENFKEFSKTLHAPQLHLIKNKEKINELSEWLDDKDFNHYFFLDGRDLRILNGFRNRLKEAIDKLESSIEVNTHPTRDNAKTPIENFKTVKNDLLDFLNSVIMKKAIGRKFDTYMDESNMPKAIKTFQFTFAARIFYIEVTQKIKDDQ